MPARVAARSPVHIFSTPTASTVPAAAQGGQGGQVQGRGPTGARVVDVDDAGVAEPGLAKERLAPDASLVDEATGGGVAEHHQVDLGRRRHRRRPGPRPPPGGPSPRRCGLAGSWASWRCRRCVGCGPWCPRYPRSWHAGRRQGGHQALELVQRLVRRSRRPRRARPRPHGMRPPPRPPRRRSRSPGGARRPWPGCRTARTSTRCPGAAPLRDRRRWRRTGPSTGSPRRRAGRPGRPPWPGVRGPPGTRRGSGRGASIRRPVWPPDVGRLPRSRPPTPEWSAARAAAGSGRVTRRPSSDRPCPDPVAHDRRSSAMPASSWRPRRVVVDAGLLVLARVAAHPDPEDEPAPGEGLEGGGLFGHRRGLAEGQLEHAGAEGGAGRWLSPPRPVPTSALEARSVPEQVVAGPQRVGAHLLGLPGRARSPGIGSAGWSPSAGPDPSAGFRAHGGAVSCTKVGRTSPIGPRGVGGSLHGHNAS